MPHLTLLITYLILNLGLGFSFHVAALQDTTTRPKLLEAVVYFAVFGALGLPLTLATLLIHPRRPQYGSGVHLF